MFLYGAVRRQHTLPSLGSLQVTSETNDLMHGGVRHERVPGGVDEDAHASSRLRMLDS